MKNVDLEAPDFKTVFSRQISSKKRDFLFKQNSDITLIYYDSSFKHFILSTISFSSKLGSQRE